MRFRASPLVVAVALGLLNPSVLAEESQSRSRSRAKPSNAAALDEPRPAAPEANATEQGESEPGER